MDKVVCFICSRLIEGGAFLNKTLREPTSVTLNKKDGSKVKLKATKTKKIYFCSGECLDKYKEISNE